tara:strand:- start:3145 stop:4089 length:945 start_codon:yes stop_codon:yes gene_type:complete
MNILITGAAGFIGTNLCKSIIKNKFVKKIYAIDSMISSDSYNLEFLKKLNNKKIKFIKHDIINVLNIKGNLDLIVNLACPASPPIYQNNSIYTLRTSTIGLFNLLDLAKKKKSRFLQASTSEIYGDPMISPQSESYNGNVNIVGPRSCYDEGKRVAESICYEYCKNFKLDIRIMRIFNTFGPFMSLNDGRVVSNFIDQIIKKKPLTVYGDGNQTRSFCFINDLIQYIEFLCFSNRKNLCGPFNIGNDKEITIRELILRLEKINNKKLKIVRKKLPIDDPKQRMPDLSKIKKLIKIKYTPLELALKSTYEFHTSK